jgi:hypothetical protein
MENNPSFISAMANLSEDSSKESDFENFQGRHNLHCSLCSLHVFSRDGVERFVRRHAGTLCVWVPGLITWWHLKAAGRTAEGEIARSLSQGNVMSTNAMYEPNGGWPTGQRGASATAMSGFQASTAASVKQPSFVLHRGTCRQGWIPKGETVEIVGRWIKG